MNLEKVMAIEHYTDDLFCFSFLVMRGFMSGGLRRLCGVVLCSMFGPDVVFCWLFVALAAAAVLDLCVPPRFLRTYVIPLSLRVARTQLSKGL